jgi:hypothetical protein
MDLADQPDKQRPVRGGEGAPGALLPQAVPAGGLGQQQASTRSSGWRRNMSGHVMHGPLVSARRLSTLRPASRLVLSKWPGWQVIRRGRVVSSGSRRALSSPMSWGGSKTRQGCLKVRVVGKSGTPEPDGLLLDGQ